MELRLTTRADECFNLFLALFLASVLTSIAPHIQEHLIDKRTLVFIIFVQILFTLLESKAFFLYCISKYTFFFMKKKEELYQIKKKNKKKTK